MKEWILCQYIHPSNINHLTPSTIKISFIKVKVDKQLSFNLNAPFNNCTYSPHDEKRTKPTIQNQSNLGVVKIKN